MNGLKSLEVWFATGSQELYGEEVLRQVAADSQTIAAALDGNESIPVRIVFKPVLTSPEAILQICRQADADPNCIGLITWMHTFSPAQMWIAGLKSLKKPFCHFHTQFNRDIPWDSIDMDFMNLNQSAHGGREFGFICSRLRLNRKIIVGHWQDPEAIERLAVWTRVAAAWHDSQGMRIARFGDNMREVAVTEGDKIEARIQFGWSVGGYGVGDLVVHINAVGDAEIDALVAQYAEQYEIAESLRGDRLGELREAARIELGLRSFLSQGNFKAFTDTFENLHGMVQLPGLAVQRLMADGFGFGAEGDWKTAALVRMMKVMADGLPGGASFMEDYTYHLDPAETQVLGAHMLEICPSIAAGRPRVESHPLSIGGKADPVRLVFDTSPGAALNASLIDMGNRFRLIVNRVDVVEATRPTPKLPVARAIWIPRPNLKVGAAAWILAGAAHHAGFSQAITPEYLEDLADMAGLEYILIDEETKIAELKKELRWNEMYYHLARGL